MNGRQRSAGDEEAGLRTRSGITGAGTGMTASGHCSPAFPIAPYFNTISGR